MSMFNKDIICTTCKVEEAKHPKYKEACAKERDEILNKKNFNFEGIGLPDELKVDDKKRRAIAMEWWNAKGNKDKDRLQREHGLNRQYTSLTGREIEGIYKAVQAK
jgi:hypothetical protein